MFTLRPVKKILPKPGKITDSLIDKLPRAYLGLVTVLALFGYLYVLLFPVLVFMGLLNIHQAIAVSDVINWQTASIWLAVVIVSGLVSYRLIQFKPTLPVGLNLAEDKAPGLFAQVQQFRDHFKRPAIHRIVVTGNYELDIVKTPKWALPVWSTNTLIIGLPVMQCHSPQHFECMLARRIGQFSKRYNFLVNWLYQLRAIWQQYSNSYKKQQGIGVELLRWYFAVYAPVYSRVSAYAARQDELNADSYAMELYNDEQVREMISTDELCRWFLHNQFWPAVYKIASIDKKSLPTPHGKMAATVHTNMGSERLQSMMVKVLKQKPQSKDAIPSLQSRIDNIGHNKVRIGRHTAGNAAAHYLGASMQNIIELVDKLWLQTFLKEKKRQHHHKQKQLTAEQVTSS